MIKGGYIYIITNRPNGTLSIGVTNNLARRIDEHRRKEGFGFTAKYNLTHLVYFETLPDIREAIAREKQLKTWRRESKVALIETSNPTWKDLWQELISD